MHDARVVRCGENPEPVGLLWQPEQVTHAEAEGTGRHARAGQHRGTHSSPWSEVSPRQASRMASAECSQLCGRHSVNPPSTPCTADPLIPWVWLRRIVRRTRVPSLYVAQV